MEVMSGKPRNTKYSQAIAAALEKAGHATNAELLSLLKEAFPDLSATTVHRVTARMAERGVISVAPSALDGSMRYDFNLNPHDHFTCVGCNNIRDLNVAAELLPKIEAELGGCKISGRLVVSGTCNHCQAIS